MNDGRKIIKLKILVPKKVSTGRGMSIRNYYIRRTLSKNYPNYVFKEVIRQQKISDGNIYRKYLFVVFVVPKKGFNWSTKS